MYVFRGNVKRSWESKQDKTNKTKKKQKEILILRTETLYMVISLISE